MGGGRRAEEDRRRVREPRLVGSVAEPGSGTRDAREQKTGGGVIDWEERAMEGKLDCVDSVCLVLEG